LVQLETVIKRSSFPVQIQMRPEVNNVMPV
jgi:hypothetical protein